MSDKAAKLLVLGSIVIGAAVGSALTSGEFRGVFAFIAGFFAVDLLKVLRS